MLLYFNVQLVVKDILEQTVPGFVHPTVDWTPVYTQTDRALRVLQAGWDIIVLQVLFTHNLLFGLIDMICSMQRSKLYSTVADNRRVLGGLYFSNVGSLRRRKIIYHFHKFVSVHYNM